MSVVFTVRLEAGGTVVAVGGTRAVLDDGLSNT